MKNPFGNKNTSGLMRGNPNGFQPGESGRTRARGGFSSAKHELARRIREQTDYGQLLIDYAKACVMGKKSIKASDGEVIKIPNDPKSRAYCHAWLTERGWGRPKQELLIAEKSGEPVREDMRVKTLAELRQIADDQSADAIDVETDGEGDGGPVH